MTHFTGVWPKHDSHENRSTCKTIIFLVRAPRYRKIPPARKHWITPLTTNNKIKYVIYRFGGPYQKSIFPRSQKRADAAGRGTYLSPRDNIFLYGPTKTVKNTLFFLVIIQLSFVIGSSCVNNKIIFT